MRKKEPYKQGLYIPRNPQKIINKKEIVYRSYLEWKWMHKFDINENIVRWGSECLFIPYIKPTTNKVHRYYPDFQVEFKDGATHILEMKPKKEIVLIQEYLETGNVPKTIKKKRPNEKLSTFQYRAIRWSINVAKWKACQAFCDKKGWKFLKISEKD